MPTGALPASPDVRSRGAIGWLQTLQAKGQQRLQWAHLRHRSVEVRAPRLHLIALDTSGSMRRGGRLAAAKGHAAALIEQAASAGEQVALLCFGGLGVELLLAPGPARRAGSARVRPVGGGGGTPLAAALAESERVLQQFRLRQRGQGGCEVWLWLLTDGRSLEQPAAPRTAEHIVIVDFDAPPGLSTSTSARTSTSTSAHTPAGTPAIGIGRCAVWARQWGAEHRRAGPPA